MVEIRLRIAARLIYVHRGLTIRELEALFNGLLNRRTLIRWRRIEAWDKIREVQKSENVYLGKVFKLIIDEQKKMASAIKSDKI